MVQPAVSNRLWLLMITVMVMLSACQPAVLPDPMIVTAAQPAAVATATPVTQASSSKTAQPAEWLIDQVVPTAVASYLRPVQTTTSANLRIGIVSGDTVDAFHYWYTLTAPFAAPLQDISGAQWMSLWHGRSDAVIEPAELWIRSQDLPAMEQAWGPCGYVGLRVISDDQLTGIDWRGTDPFILLPFEMLQPELKVVPINGQDPLDAGFDGRGYPLVISFGLTHAVSTDAATIWAGNPSNRDPQQMTRLLMTGVTALVRRIGAVMEKHGMTYPISEIQPWLDRADLVHISNEVSFYDQCPPANWYQTTVQFCSRPEYLQLLDAIDPAVVELSGNHLIDYDIPPFVESLDLYRKRGWQTIAGGMTLAEAQAGATVTHNDNRFFFISCNDDGPEYVFAAEDRAGVARCDFDQVEAEVRAAATQGLLPVVSLQLKETYQPQATAYQQALFERMRQAGAVIVQGTQAHVPLTFNLRDGAFLHYGLGNFLFDQMINPPELGQQITLQGEPVDAVRLIVADLHTFYDGRLINTTLFTGINDDYGLIRPLSNAEREDFLAWLFDNAK